MDDSEKPKKSSSSESSSSSSSSGSEIGTDIELSPSNQPIKKPEPEPEPQPPPLPPPPTFSSDDGEIEEEIGEEHGFGFPPGMSPAEGNPFSSQFPGDGGLQEPLSPPQEDTFSGRQYPDDGQPDPFSPPSERQSLGQFSGTGRPSETASTAGEDPFAGQYPGPGGPFEGDFPESDGAFSDQKAGGVGSSLSRTPQGSSSEWEAQGMHPDSSSATQQQHFGPDDGDGGSDQFNLFASQGGGPISSPSTGDDATDDDPWRPTPGGFGPSSDIPAAPEWNQGAPGSDPRINEETEQSSTETEEGETRFQTGAAGAQLESPFEPFAGALSNSQDADPWDTTTPGGFGPPSFKTDELTDNFGTGPPSGVGATDSTEAKSSSDDGESHDETVVAVNDAPAATPPATPAEYGRANEDSLFSGGLFGNEFPPRVASSTDDDNASPQTVSQPEIARSPASSIAAAEEHPLFPQGSAAANFEQTTANDARSSASSSSSSSSSNEDVPEDLSHVNEPTEDIPFPSAGSTPGVGATQSRVDSTGQLREQKSLFSSSLGDARTTSSTIHDEAEEPVGATASEASPDVVASTDSSQTRTQAASSMLNQKPSVSKTDSNVSRRRSSLGQVSSSTTRRRSSLGQTSSTVSQRRSSQSSSPASPPEAASPTKPMPKQAKPSQQDISGTSQRRQSAQRGTPPSEASSPVRSRASLVRDGVSSVAKKSSALVAQSSGLFRTGSAFRGARVSTDVVQPSPTPSDGIARRTSSSRGGGALVRTAESRSGVKVTGSTTHPSSSGMVGPDRAGFGAASPTPASPPAAATATPPAAADSEGAQSPPMTLAGMLAGSTLASLARDGLSRLVHPAAAAPSTDSDSGPERASDSTRRLESRRRPSQQVSWSQSLANQQPQSAPSRRLSQTPSGQGVGSKRNQQRSQVAQQQSRELSQSLANSATRQPVQDESRSRQDQDGGASQRDSQPVINQPKSQEIHPEPKDYGKQKSPDEGSLDPKSSPSHSESLKDKAQSQKEQTDVSKKENDSPDEFKSQTNLVDQCTVSRLRFCDGRLPYRTTSLPNFAGASSDQELVDNLVFFEAISESGCSPLAAEYVCAAMEPQCVSRPTPHVLPPCRHFCQDIASSCGAAIPSSLSRNRAFNCSLMPDSTDPGVCYSSAAEGCVLSEFACADQTSCLPAQWRCDGTPQCDDDSDELGCDGCSPLQYRCRPAGGCVDRTHLCDGFADCTEGDDERDCLQKDKEFASASSSAEHQA